MDEASTEISKHLKREEEMILPGHFKNEVTNIHFLKNQKYTNYKLNILKYFSHKFLF